MGESSFRGQYMVLVGLCIDCKACLSSWWSEAFRDLSSGVNQGAEDDQVGNVQVLKDRCSEFVDVPVYYCMLGAQFGVGETNMEKRLII